MIDEISNEAKKQKINLPNGLLDLRIHDIRRTMGSYQAITGASLPKEDRIAIGLDIATAEYGWPVGMPLCRSLGDGLWEIRSTLPSHKIARVIFCVCDGNMVLLHGFIKKTQKTPTEDLSLAKKRKKEIER